MIEDIYVKQDVSKHEYDMHKYIYDLKIVNVPKIISYENQTLTLVKINEMNVSDMHGEIISDVPKSLVKQIQKIIKILHDNNIEYPDITGYNFIEKDGIIWIIDFEHSSIIQNNHVKDAFVTKFINGLNEWNPNFK